MERRHFPSFYRSHVTRVYRFIFYRVNGNKELAEDLTQDVFLKALAAFDRYDPAVSESAWMYTIARNHLINHMQKQHPSVALEAIENTDWDRVDWAEILSASYDERRLLEALKQLPETDAEIIRLKYLEGWPYEDIAQKIGKTAGSLRIQTHRALKCLRKILKQK
ncbi:MAG: RNA polymerase sigma factor [Patescibacteria group bacterium]